MKSFQEFNQKVFQELKTTLATISNESAATLADAIIEAERVFLAGAGRSGCMAKAFAIRLMHVGSQVYVVGETITPNITERDLLLITSGSGATEGLLIIAQNVQKIGARLGLITINPDSPIGQLADIILTIPASSLKLKEDRSLVRSIQTQGSLFEQSLLLTLDTIVLMLLERCRKTPDEILERHANLE